MICLLAARLRDGEDPHEKAHSLLREGLKRRGISSPVCYTAQGKPYLAGCDTEISITHTDGAVLCAIAPFPCGIDAEPVGRRISARVRERFLDGCTEEDALYRWTRRESMGKLTGEGFFTTADSDACQTVYLTVLDCLVAVTTNKNTPIALTVEIREELS